MPVGATIRIESTSPRVLDTSRAVEIGPIAVSASSVEVSADGRLDFVSAAVAALVDRVMASQPRSIVAARTSPTEFPLRPASA